MDSCGNAIGTLPATEGVKAAGTLALVAHVDTSPAASGEGVNAREVLYTGEDIELGHGVILSEKQFPAMKDVRGQVLLVTDGSTLLGADDKAGVAEIMTAVEKLIARAEAVRPTPIKEQMAQAAREAGKENAARTAPAKKKEARDDR